MHSQWKRTYGDWSLVGENKISFYLERNRRRKTMMIKRCLVESRTEFGQTLVHW